MLKKIVKKGTKYLFVLFAIVIIGGGAGVIMERMIVPWLASIPYFEGFPLLQKINEKVTVINKTEHVTVYENFSVQKTSQGILPAVVSIVEYSAAEKEEKKSVQTIKSSEDIQKHVKTGIILTGDGLIMSIAKNVDPFVSGVETPLKSKKYKYRVFTSDGREFEATKKYTDPYSDIEYFKIESTNLPAVQFGNSDELENGEKIIVVGNATGEYQNTFSLGVINEKNNRFSLLNSELSSSEKMEGAIICDAKIDQKNMGGPVVDFNGTVVGIAHYIKKDDQDVGFIIPINKLRLSIDKVMSGNNLQPATLGVYYLSINKEISLLNSLPVDKGALIYSFTGQQGLAIKSGSAAQAAKLQLGDIILAVDDEQVSLDNPLSQIIAKRSRGELVELKILRQGEQISVKTTLK